MDSGRRKHVFTVKEWDTTAPRDEYGEVVTKRTVCRARGNVQVMSGSEQIKSGLQLSDEYLNILMTLDRRINHDQFIIWNGYEYSISGIRPLDNMRDMVVTASRQVT